MKLITIILIADAIISAVLGIAEVKVKRNIDKTISDCIKDLGKSVYGEDDN